MKYKYFWLSCNVKIGSDEMGREGFEPPKALSQQIYSLSRLTASLPTHDINFQCPISKISQSPTLNPDYFPFTPTFHNLSISDSGTKAKYFWLSRNDKNDSDEKAGNRIRTRDPQFTKLLLYQLSYPGINQFSISNFYFKQISEY